jgi:hypothetical protein
VRDLAGQNEAVHALPELLHRHPAALAARLLDIAMEFCHAGSAGISWLEQTEAGNPIFRWTALAGRFAPHLDGTVPRNFSPCGLCLDLGRPILLAYPGRLFPYLNDIPIPVVEGLAVPVYGIGRRPLGTIWVAAHDEAWRFDGEDLRLMTRLADFAAACPPTPQPTIGNA